MTLEIKIADGSTYVFWDEEPIVILKDNRFLRFRSKPENDHWLGTNARPMDLGWAYSEKEAEGYTNKSVKAEQEENLFRITLRGIKEKVPGVEQVNVLEGRWNEAVNGFEYILSSTLKGDLESWYSKSGWARNRGNVQPLDYHIERMSMLDRVVNDNHGPDLYDYVVYSDDGKQWTGIPKLGVPRTMLKGTYFYDFYVKDHGFIGFIDDNEEGWIAQLLESTGDMRIEICWSWYDIHNVLENSIPKCGSSDTFELSYAWHFTPTSIEKNREIMSCTEVVEWKDIPNYQLPIFSRHNKFDKQFGGTEWTDPWLKSSYDCIWDRTTGYDDHYSLSIQKTDGGGAAWYGWFFGKPFEFEDVKNKRFRVRAMVKTEACSGKVRIGVGQTYTMSPIYGLDITHTNPTPEWTYSQEISGNNDWTELSVEFIAQKHGCDTFILDQRGPGKSWFDNVIIEPADESK
jgi:hypothetical protein